MTDANTPNETATQQAPDQPTVTNDADELELLKEMGVDAARPKPQEDDDHDEPAPTADGDAAGTVEPQAETDDEVRPVAGDAATPEAGGADAAAGNEPAAAAGGGGSSGDRPVQPSVPAGGQPVAGGADAASAGQPAVKSRGQIIGRMRELSDQIKAGTIDPFEGNAEIASLQVELAERQEAIVQPIEQEREAERAWAGYTSNPAYKGITRQTMEEKFKVHANAMRARGLSGDALRAAATALFDAELAQLATSKPAAKPAAAAAPPKAPTPITTKGGMVVPPSSAAVPAAPKQLTDEEELLQTVRKVPGGLKAMRG